MNLFPSLVAGAALLAAGVSPVLAQAPKHTFEIGETELLLDGKLMQIRCGELHFARVPKEYWRHRLQLCKAMGLNTVCAYLFWNLHEFEQGKFNWEGQADAAEFCRLAQEEGLWVLLRPGPYACAEWDGGGLPWWLLKKPDIALRSRDPDFMAASRAWLAEVSRVLGPLQVTKGGPILMAQVENEYGFYGTDAEYMGQMRQAMLDAGFDIPLFACNPTGNLNNGRRDDLFNVVNFGSDPATGFKKLREIQPKGPLMCGEFYPGWFDTWGAPHHLGKTDQYLKDLGYMLDAGASFSIYMAHGGTSFGMWAGADRPFKPDTSSYDYDAPISEAGWIGDKFERTRDLMAKHLLPGEKLVDPPQPMPVMAIPSFKLKETAAIFENLPAAIPDAQPRHMEAYDQGHGCIIYSIELPAGPFSTLELEQVHDFGWVFLNGKEIGVTDRRSRRFKLDLPDRKQPARLDILVEAMGHVNFGKEIHDRKGIMGKVKLVTLGKEAEVEGEWSVRPLKLDAPLLSSLKWKTGGEAASGPKFWRGTFQLGKTADTFLDLRTWGKGVIWVNGHCLARHWNIGPTQTAYLPGVWLKEGENEVIILDLLGPEKPVLAGLEKPILDQLRPELDFARKKKGELVLKGHKPALEAAFSPGPDVQEVKFPQPLEGSQFALEMLSAHDGKPFAAIAEFDLLDPEGKSISHASWTIAYVDSEELAGEDGSASNAINGQTADFWHSEWKEIQPGYPHHLVIDLGANTKVGGFRYTPRAGNNPGRIKDYRVFVGSGFVKESK
ncbi:beta-galactosidase [Luteolibacter flavescens]|uniref:Beta-galactosidase n=1 Tax=Luteolibacter flavescens TaxID=1859460 RepID=A0ABT3FIG4_9BACT|nr:beta-galactosidase [Luteolibacter flavescens]MCW1883359.1 beta-galactosidase [Luteolibacter flavescens]